MITVERTAPLPARRFAVDHTSDRSDGRGYGAGAWTEASSLGVILGRLGNPGEPAATGGEGGWRLGDVSSDKFGGVFL